MTINEIEQLITIFGTFGSGIIIGGVIIYFFIKSYIPSYLNEKAKNLATKEDISEITDKVEGIKTGYAKVLEELKSNHQLKHASVEREKNIKKEVYLSAVEAITRSHNMITNFPNLNIANEDIAANMADDTGVMAKVQIVGSRETVKATTEFMAAIGSKTLDLMLERSVLLDRKAEIEQEEAISAKSAQEIDRYIELMKNLNLQGNQDQELWATMDRQIKFEHEQIGKHNKKISSLWDTQRPEHLEYTKKCTNIFFEIAALLPPIILAIRDELDLDINPEDYLDIFNNNLNIGKEVLNTFLIKISN